MTDFGRRPDVMLKSVYDDDDDGVISLMHTRADMERATYDPLHHGVVADSQKLEFQTKAQVRDHTPKAHIHSPPAAHKATHQKGGTDEITIAGLVGKSYLVDIGDPSTFSYTKTTLSLNGTWQDLDLSSFLTDTTTHVLLYVVIEDDLVETEIMFRKRGNQAEKNIAKLRTQVANVIIDANFIVPVDVDQKIQYKATNTGWGFCNIVVCGYVEI